MGHHPRGRPWPPIQLTRKPSAVDYLAERKFPVEHVAIIAEGIRLVEQVTGRRGYGKAAFGGAITTGLVGAFFGYLLGLFSLTAPSVSDVILAFYGLIFGAVVSAILDVIFHALAGGRRDFNSETGLQANRYCLQVDAIVTDSASRLLEGLRTRRDVRFAAAEPRQDHPIVH